jgi:hypothetical protein
MKFPWMQFYPGDWLKDTGVSMCSLATRGAWIELLIAMHGRNRSGEIAGTREKLAQLCRCSTVELDHALTELKATETANVMIRNNIVTVINRRMKREHKEREANRLRVQRCRHKEQCNGDPPDIRHKSDVISQNQRSDLKRLNDERITRAREPVQPDTNGHGLIANRSSINRNKENQLMDELRSLLGDEEMESAGGHWRVDHVRKHPDLLERCIAEVKRMKKEGEVFGKKEGEVFSNNAAACLEDLVKRWK